MANNLDVTQSLQSLLSNHFYQVKQADVTNVTQDGSGDYLFTIALRASSCVPIVDSVDKKIDHGPTNANVADPSTETDLPTQNGLNGSNAGAGGHDIARIAAVASAAAVTALTSSFRLSTIDNSTNVPKKPDKGEDNANAPVAVKTEPQ